VKKLLLIVFLFPFFVHSNELAFKLLEIKGLKALFGESKGQMANIMYMVDPDLKEHSNLVEQWELNYFAWNKVRVSLATIYTSRFSDDELENIIDFYLADKPSSFFESDTGKKFQSLSHEISQEFTINGHQYMTKVSPFLYEAVGFSNKQLKRDK